MKNKEMKNESRSEIYKVDIISPNDARYIIMSYINDGKKVLDVGAACGDLAVALKKEKSVQVWGMEYDLGSIALAKDTGMYEEVYQVDLNAFNAADFGQFVGSFDYIVFGDVLEHILAPKKTLETFKQFLKSDGKFLLSIPNIAHASIKSNLLLDDFTYTPTGLLDETHIRFFSRKTIPAFLGDIGLEINNISVTYRDKMGFQPTNPYAKLPTAVRRQIFQNYHSYVVQYVMEVGMSAASPEKLFAINAKELVLTNTNSPAGLIALRRADLLGLRLPFLNILDMFPREMAHKVRFAIFSPLKFLQKYTK
jgi:2-polyprenyl-3-methyl-5-hydroxy-6-metoxy-1,4-benzoquinol methylase